MWYHSHTYPEQFTTLLGIYDSEKQHQVESTLTFGSNQIVAGVGEISPCVQEEVNYKTITPSLEDISVILFQTV